MAMAAAYASLLSLFNNLELIQSHPRHSFSFDNKQIESLSENVTFLIDFVERYESHQGRKEAADDLQRQIAFAAQAAVDLIESNVVDQIRAGSTRGGKTSSDFLLNLQNVIEEMDFLRRKAIKATKGQTYSATTSSSTPPTLTFKKNSLVGTEAVSFKVMDLLIGEPSSRQVIPIVGMGGIGKTTLAENIFELKYVAQHFDVRCWVSISQEYNVKQIFLTLLSREGISTNETVDDLGEQLHKKLWGRRYLIVLDDVWSLEAWDKIRLFLPDDGINKSRIILTTRLQNVADFFGSSCVAMDFLADDDSWNLFCEKAFGEQRCPPELEDIGKTIVKKCKGLPLAIVVVAGHLGKTSRVQEYWENVANHMNSVLNSGENDEQLFNILSLSYSHLPIHLKPCFLHMGTYPGNGWISVSKIIKLWIAEGFLKPNIAQSLEEIAEGHLNDLHARNLTLVSGVSFKIHDVLRELCLEIDEKEKFFHVLHAAKRERSREEMHHHLKLVRVVADNVDRALANEVGGDFLEANFQQINLRYLECLKVDRKYKSLPSLYLSSSISLLWNLQTIIIRGAYPLVIAPYEIWEMVHLRHLQFRRISLPDPLPNDRLVLQNLGVLTRVESFKLDEEVCKRIPNIKNMNLTYYNLEKACDEHEPISHYCLYNLSSFHKLESLDCTFSVESGWRDFALSLTFPSSIKSLSLCNSRFHWEELTMMVGSLPNLEILELSSNSVIGSEWTPVHGKFLRLKSLKIDRCDDLICWNAEGSHFPVLEEVILEELSRLDEFPSSVGDIPTIRRIALRRCSVSSAVSALRMLVEQEEFHGNYSIQLEVSFSGDDEKILRFWEKVEQDDLSSNNLLLFPIT